jgi:predicted Fe-Mo cluster-binding NifX family protein
MKGALSMKIAIPLANGKLSMHFGHCEEFALVEVDEKTKSITGKDILAAPPHQPGLLPRWLAEKGANVIIAGGMGSRAQGLFAQNNIKVVVGAGGGTPEELTNAYLDGSLKTGANLCDH